MGRKNNIGILILAIFVALLAATIAGEILNIVFESLGLQNIVVQRVLVSTTEYEFGPFKFDLIIVSLTFGLELKLNVLSLLAIGTAWYYVKYSY